MLGRAVFRSFLLSVGASMVLLGCTADNNGEGEASQSPTATVARSEEGTPAASPVAGGTNVLPAIDESLEALVEEVQPSVVAVVIDQGEGSGVVWDDQGHIITNNHVIANATSISVVLASGEELPATLVASDPLTDLAVLEVERTDLKGAEFESELPRVGSLAIAVGNPLGFESSVTLGIVSGLHRAVPSGGQTPALVDLLQTDAAISPGNSGGALVNGDGRIIGVNVAYLPPGQSGAVSIGFAIPSTTVVDVVEQLLETGTVQHAFLGIQPRPITPGIAQQLNLDTSAGVLVFTVTPDSAAAAAGMMPGDVITRLGDQDIASVEDLFAALRDFSPGDQVDVVVIREGAEQTLSVTLGERPQTP